MAQITVSREVAAPLTEVWSTLSDFGGVHRFSTTVESSPIIDGTPTCGVGSERVCNMYDGHHIKERVTESVVNERLSIEVFDTSMPIQRGNATFSLSESSTGGTTVTMNMDYVVKFGPLGRVMDALMMKGMMTRTLSRLLEGLDHHLEHGEQISRGWTPTAKVA